MRHIVFTALACLIVSTLAVAPSHLPHDQDHLHSQSQVLNGRSASADDSLVIDLGYEVYAGSSDPYTGVNAWKGIRFAAPPTGLNRWQKPATPNLNRGAVISASDWGPRCPQSTASDGTPTTQGITGDEDCLFLNVFTPSVVAEPLPVLVWIHGGGYGEQDSRLDMTEIINANNQSFVAVSIEYRLGAFGFLSSQEVFDHGVVNAGLYDQHFALQWVQDNIKLFGGDASRVTVSGESAGGGSVMLLDMAFGGSLGDELFQHTIAASPYLPALNVYNSTTPTDYYNAFVEQAGCSSYSGLKFDCLVAASTELLQNASTYVIGTANFGTWAFAPVIDSSIVQDVPSSQLLARKVNGHRILTGNNAVEGSGFVPGGIIVEEDVVQWLQRTFPTLDDADVSSILAQYPLVDLDITATSPRFATNGLDNPNANEVSPEATGQQQRAYNMYSESTFVCASYWLAEAYTNASGDVFTSAGYKYQYSVVPATHGVDTAAYFSPPEPPHSPDFALAFKQIWGNFITSGSPSISSLVANGQSTGNDFPNPVSDWPVFAQGSWPMVNLNETFTNTASIDGSAYSADATKNAITIVNASAWEAGRGSRCEFWRTLGSKIGI